MGRAKRVADGGMVFHVLNRANARGTIFEKPDDYAAFERVLSEALDRVAMRVLSYCLMPNHWHLVLWPRRDGDLSKFMGWLTLTHTQRWHAHFHTVGTGHLYQGRFKSFPIQDDEHFLTVCRYVERNALRANLVDRAEDWTFGSLWHRHQRNEFSQRVLSDWPIPCPRQWLQYVNKPQSDAEVAVLRRSVNRGTPFGDSGWTKRMVKRLGLEVTVRPRGRPKK
jgi:putative transposase